MKKICLFVLPLLLATSCNRQQTRTTFTGAEGEVKLITLDPGHFHAALVQKTSYPQISPDVYVYSPGGDDLHQHLSKIAAYNQRAEEPT